MTGIGIDGCKGGWFAVRIAADGFSECVSKNITDLWEHWAREADICLIDIPIGLCDSKPSRECDQIARTVLRSPRAASVFNPPIRKALRATTWEQANDFNRKGSGKGLSKQSFAIGKKINEVDDFLQADTSRQLRLREVHPELLFHALNGQRATTHSKKKPAGYKEGSPSSRAITPAQLPR
jgi:predicted RNase H-like nuclease